MFEANELYNKLLNNAKENKDTIKDFIDYLKLSETDSINFIIYSNDFKEYKEELMTHMVTYFNPAPIWIQMRSFLSDKNKKILFNRIKYNVDLSHELLLDLCYDTKDELMELINSIKYDFDYLTNVLSNQNTYTTFDKNHLNIIFDNLLKLPHTNEEFINLFYSIYDLKFLLDKYVKILLSNKDLLILFLKDTDKLFGLSEKHKKSLYQKYSNELFNFYKLKLKPYIHYCINFKNYISEKEQFLYIDKIIKHSEDMSEINDIKLCESAKQYWLSKSIVYKLT